MDRVEEHQSIQRFEWPVLPLLNFRSVKRLDMAGSFPRSHALLYNRLCLLPGLP